MDVGDPSNFERILALYSNDYNAIKADISGATYSDKQIRNIIKTTFDRTKYILDPHGACGYQALRDNLKDSENGIFLETAHPAKFLDTVQNIIGTSIQIPIKLQEYMNGTKSSIQLDRDFAPFKEFLLAE
jgi:threonine synthase